MDNLFLVLANWLGIGIFDSGVVTPTPGVRKKKMLTPTPTPEVNAGVDWLPTDSQIGFGVGNPKKNWLPESIESKFTPGRCVLNWKLNSYTLNQHRDSDFVDVVLKNIYNFKKKITVSW